MVCDGVRVVCDGVHACVRACMRACVHACVTCAPWPMNRKRIACERYYNNIDNGKSSWNFLNFKKTLTINDAEKILGLTLFVIV